GREGGDARPDKAEIEKSGSRTGPTVENEGHWPRRRIRRFRDEGRIKNLRRAFAALVEQGKRACGRSIGELTGRQIDAVFRDRVARQQSQHAGRVLFMAVLSVVLPRTLSCIFMLGAALGL